MGMSTLNDVADTFEISDILMVIMFCNEIKSGGLDGLWKCS